MTYKELGISLIELNNEIKRKGGEEYNVIKTKINELFPKLVIASKEEKRYFSGASLEVYKDYFYQLLKKEEKESIEFFYPAFIKGEFNYQRRYLNKYNKFSKTNILEGFYIEHLDNQNENLFRRIISKRLTFLETEMHNNGIEVIRKYDEFGNGTVSFKQNIANTINEKPEKENLPVIDLSTAIGTEKIIFLEQFGILDYLRAQEPFKTSTNKLATAISSITGITQSTAQSYLNPIVNPGADQKNNPLNSTNKVEAIRQTLTNLGFKPFK